MYFLESCFSFLSTAKHITQVLKINFLRFNHDIPQSLPNKLYIFAIIGYQSA
jgi:hypothetical protein